MWGISSITAYTGEQVAGTIWGGGGGIAIGPQQPGVNLDAIGASYLVACGRFGTLTLAETNSAKGVALLNVNGANTVYGVSGNVNITVTSSNTVQIASGAGTYSFNLLNQITNVGPVLKTAFLLVLKAPQFKQAWEAGALAFLQSIGLPRSTVDNLDYGAAGFPPGAIQYQAWLQLIGFNQNPTDCDDCMTDLAGYVTVLSLSVPAACLAVGPSNSRQAANAIALMVASKAIAGISGLTALQVATLAVAGYWSNPNNYVNAVCYEICTQMGSCP